MSTMTSNVNNKSAAEPTPVVLKDFTTSLTLMNEKDQHEHQHDHTTSIVERKV